MNHSVICDAFGIDSLNMLESLNINNKIIENSTINKLYYLNKQSLQASNIDLYNLIESVEKLLENNLKNNAYSVLTFDIERYNEIYKIYGGSFTNKLITDIGAILQRHIKEPDIFFSINENFVIFLENYKSIDIAMFVIQLSEEISDLYPELNIKLSFGICISGKSDQKISFLYKKAFYAMSTIKGQEQTLLADYSELIYRKHKN